MIKQINIYDLDGTVIDSSHRYQTAPCGTKIDLPYWQAHDIPEFIAKDTLLPLAEKYQSDLQNPEIYVIAATARACIKNDANYSYLRDVLGWPNKFVHRQGPDDNRGGSDLKIQAIKPLLSLRQFANAKIRVFEDNEKYLQDMCQAFGAHGTFVRSEQGH